MPGVPWPRPKRFVFNKHSLSRAKPDWRQSGSDMERLVCDRGRTMAGNASNESVAASANLTVAWPVLAFALGLTVTVDLFFGIAPSWTARKADILITLRKAGRGTTGVAGRLLRLGLVSGQVAVATILVVGALLLLQSFDRLQRVDPGFRPDHLLTASITVSAARYPTVERAQAFFSNIVSEVEGLPGVVSVGMASGVPMGGNNTSMPITPVDPPAGFPEQGIQAFWRVATTGYLRTLEVPLRRGRFFESSDEGRQAIILSENLAKRLWPDQTDPIGQEVKLGNGDILTVVGVAGDVRQLDLRTEPQFTMYFQRLLSSTLTLAVRTTTEPADLAGPLREAVKRVDPAQPIFDVRTMDRILESNAQGPRLQTALLTSFAILALLLGAVGVAGVVAYTVERRTPELAVRLALGATPAQAMRNAAGGGLTASFIGLVLGLFAAWRLGQLMSTLLFEVQPNDPTVFGSAGASLLAVAVIACWLPARRATRIDPAAALKQE